MNILRMQLLSFVMLSIHCVLLHSMELIESEGNKQLLEIIASNIPHEYEAQRALAGVNKKYNKIIEDTYRQDKKCIEKYIATDLSQAQVTGYRSWNKNFSRCAWVTYDDVIEPKDLHLTLVGIVNNQVAMRSTSWKYFYFSIFEDNRPFFDKDGQACFYGYGKTQTCGGVYCSFAQYCLDPNGTESRDKCYFYYYTDPNDMESRRGQSMSMLLQYPVLAKAFLQSKKVTVDHCCNKYDRVKEFYTTGMTIPENYTFFKKSVGLEQVEKMDHFSYYSCYTSYDSLEDDMRKAIDDEYEKQQQEKNNTNSPEK